MTEIKTIISIIAVILSLVAYIPYLKDTISGKTLPHIYSWFIWGFVTAIAFGLQVYGGAGVGSWVTLTVVVICFFVFILGLRNGKKDITVSDKIFLILSFGALVLWLIAKQPILSAILVSLIDIFGFIPTVRKSWNKPYTETLILYEINAFRHVLSFISLQQYSIITWMNPVTWVIANTMFSLMLIIRRKQVGK